MSELLYSLPLVINLYVLKAKEPECVIFQVMNEGGVPLVRNYNAKRGSEIVIETIADQYQAIKHAVEIEHAELRAILRRYESTPAIYAVITLAVQTPHGEYAVKIARLLTKTQDRWDSRG